MVYGTDVLGSNPSVLNMAGKCNIPLGHGHKARTWAGLMRELSTNKVTNVKPRRRNKRRLRRQGKL